MSALFCVLQWQEHWDSSFKKYEQAHSMKTMGKCLKCKRNLLLDAENGLCIICENDSLKEKIVELELMLVQCRREKQAIYAKLSIERAKMVKYE